MSEAKNDDDEEKSELELLRFQVSAYGGGCMREHDGVAAWVLRYVRLNLKVNLGVTFVFILTLTLHCFGSHIQVQQQRECIVALQEHFLEVFPEFLSLPSPTLT